MSDELHPIFGSNWITQEDSDRFFLTTCDGARAVVVKDSSVRWCNVSEPAYHSMPLAHAFNDVKHAILSKCGEFLCIYNDVELRIIEIPWANSDVSSMTGAFQDFCYTSSGAGTKQVLFHPLAYQQESIVILKDDDSITIANWKDFEDSEPDVLNLTSGAYSLDSSITDIEGIAFGQDGLTLYALSVSEGADIHAFYPCLAPRMDFSKAGLDRLMYKSLIQYDSLNVESNSDVKRNTIKQLKFVSGLYREYKNDEDIEIPLGQRQVRGQGPFTIAPFPEQSYSSTGTAIASMPIDEQNDLLLMSLDDGNVAVLLQDLEPTMNWDGASYNYNNSFALVELIELKSQIIEKLVIRSDECGKFYALTSDGVYSIDTSKWSRIMANCLTESDLRPLAETKLKSEISFTEIKGTSKSVALWNAPSQTSVVMVSNRDVKSKQVSKTIAKDRKDDVESGAQNETEVYRARYSQPTAEILQLNRKFQAESTKPLSKVIPVKERQTPLKNDSSEVQLDILTEVSKDFISKIALGQALGASLHNRVCEQEFDLTRQLITSSEMMEKQRGILAHFDSQASRSESLHTRRTGLMSRFDKLKDNLSKIQDSQRFKELDISKVEIEWFKEIRNQVLTFNRNVHNQKRLQDQLIYLKQEINRVSVATEDQDSQARDEWRELRQMLEQDTKILQDCNNQLNCASRQVPAHP